MKFNSIKALKLLKEVRKHRDCLRWKGTDYGTWIDASEVAFEEKWQIFFIWANNALNHYIGGHKCKK